MSTEKGPSFDRDVKKDDLSVEKTPKSQAPIDEPGVKELEDAYNWTENGPEDVKDQGRLTLTTEAPAGESHFNYLNWQFLMVFLSISFGFYASLLGTINSWNGAQTVIPLMLPLAPLQQMVEPLNFAQISAGANLTAIADGLNFTRMATGINATEVVSGMDPDRMFWGVVHTSLTDFLLGLNVTGAVQGINLTEVISGINVTRTALGLNITQLRSGLNLNDFLPVAVDQFPAAVNQVKAGLWAYPTLIFTQIISSVFFGRLSDYIGRRWIFLFGNLLSFIGFLSVGQAKDGSTVVGLITLVGIGTGIQIMGPWLVLGELVPVRHRFTVTGLCVSLLGPLLVCHVAIVNAFITQTSDTWHWPYHVNAILSFLSLVGLFVSYFPPTYRQIHGHPPVKDWLGLIVFTIFIGLVSYALGWAKLIWVWASPQVIVVVVIGGTGVVAFWIYEYNYGTDHSAYPAYLVRRHDHVSQMILSALNSLMWLFAPIVQFVLFVTVTPRFGMQGAWEQTWGAGLFTGFLSASVFLARPKHVKWHLVLGTTFGMMFLVALRPIGHANQYRTSSAMMFFTGLGHGYSTVVAYVTVTTTAHHRDLGLVVGLASGYRGLIFAAARILLLTLYINQLLGKAPRMLIEAFESVAPVPQVLTEILGGLAVAQSAGSITELLNLPVVTTMTDALAAALAQSWKFVVSVAYIYFFVNLIYSIFSPSTDSYLSDKISSKLNPGGLFQSVKQRHTEAP